MIIIRRFTDIKRLKKAPENLLVYGRRKTGKTFLIRNFFKDADYFFVKRNRTIFFEGRSLSYDAFMELLREKINKNELVIIDEFHRLGEEFLDFLHYESPQRIILVTSTLYKTKKLLKEKSPILGLFYEFSVDIIDERDILLNLKDYIKDPKKLIEYSVFLREPILLRSFKEDMSLDDLIRGFKESVPSLISEIFIEEEKELTERYEGIIRAVAIGESKISKITSYLYSRRLLPKEEHGLVTQYINDLKKMGILEGIREFKKRNFYYFLKSPMMELYYYLDEKYNFSEEDLDKEVILERVPYYVERFFRELLSKMFGLRRTIINLPDLEIDIALLKFQKLKIVAEVKWVKDLDKSELRKIEEKLNKFKGVKRILIVPDENILPYEPEKIEVWDVERVLEILKKGL